MQPKKIIRLLEILPGFVTWMALIAPIVLSFYIPVVVGIFILIFDLYWLYKAIIMGYYLITGYLKMERNIRVDWNAKLHKIPNDKLHLDYKNIYQVVILATYKEELDILRPSVESFAKSDYPKDRKIFVFATEERDLARAHKNAKILKDEFGNNFAHFIITKHPDGIAGEVKAKGANVTWAARKLSELIKKEGINPENVMVSTADADSRFHPRYFSALTYLYVCEPNRLRRSFQPIPIFANNIWDAPSIARILAFGSTFWQLIESTRPWRLINFSTHAMSLATLEAIDYWDTGVVNEDSRQFWRAYFAFDGDHQVIPIFLPVYMDAVLAENFWVTLKQQYQQRLRWAYGVEHFPYVVVESFKKNQIGLSSRLIKVYRLFEANFSWATASIFISIVGWLPLILNQEFSQTVLAHNIPYYASRLLTFTWVGLIISALLSLKMMPPRPARYRNHKTLGVLLMWVLVPISAIFFGSIPAIDAQTRLMLGKYLTFKTTKKVSVG